MAGHSVGGNPTGRIEFGFHLLAPHLLCDIGYSDPEHSDGIWAISRLIVDGEFNFIGFVDGDVEDLVLPSIRARRLCASLDGVFDLDCDERVGTPGETGQCRVIHVLDRMNL